MLHVSWSERVERAREPAGERWCFRCRKRLPHDAVFLAAPFPSYEDPVWILRCSGCGGDHTSFPGCEL